MLLLLLCSTRCYFRSGQQQQQQHENETRSHCSCCYCCTPLPPMPGMPLGPLSTSPSLSLSLSASFSLSANGSTLCSSSRGQRESNSICPSRFVLDSLCVSPPLSPSLFVSAPLFLLLSHSAVVNHFIVIFQVQLFTMHTLFTIVQHARCKRFPISIRFKQSYRW